MSDSLKAATNWYAKLNADNVTETDRHAFQNWRQASEDNDQAWQKIQSIAGQFDGIAPTISKATLLTANQPKSLERRRLLKNLGIVAAATTTGWLTYQHQPWQTFTADYATQTGDQREIQLADNTKIILNTNSAINIDYTEKSRTVILIKGEIFIETGHGANSDLSFIVQTKQGDVRALGTKFTVRNNGNYHTVAVFEGVVEIIPTPTVTLTHDPTLRVNQGDMVTFGEGYFSQTKPLTPSADLWVKGMFNVVNMPLKDFVLELRRYHKGILRCDSNAAKILISGAFPIKDMNALFASLERTYPVRVDSVTKYWVTVKAI
ncbi:FecR domain-containing protein [Methylotenera versatilis]|uniref:FecR domain-containing protein n=1 Tax=Methylotenera versatilis TaxID=1055487 RepID=UPI000648F98F|nr:FecR domain-containing protein [Methylotenera versatilis]